MKYGKHKTRVYKESGFSAAEPYTRRVYKLKCLITFFFILKKKHTYTFASSCSYPVIVATKTTTFSKTKLDDFGVRSVRGETTVISLVYAYR